MLKNAVRFVRTFIDIFNGNRLTRAAAALSYYMTMTFFPVVIVLYTLLGNSYDKAMRIVAFAENLMAEETASYIRDFLGYVAANNSTAMMIAGLTVLVTSASAAIRSMQFTIGDAQGGMRFQGIWGFIVSILISLLLIVAIYFGMLVMLTGRSVMNRLNELLPFIDISQSWNHMRFVILGGIMFLLIWGVYEYPKRKDRHVPHLSRSDTFDAGACRREPRVLGVHRRVGQILAGVRLACVHHTADDVALHEQHGHLLRHGAEPDDTRLQARTAYKEEHGDGAGIRI